MPRQLDCTQNKDLQIALTLSGGGYRASVFHIGVLSYLYHLKLDDGSRMLDHVTVVSTVSGGTITGVNYLLALEKEGSLNMHLAELFEKIKSNNLADKVFENLYKKKKNKTLSMIKELANVYNEVFFKDEKQTFSDIKRIVQKSPVHHFSAYATDISNAMPFRFQAVKDCYKEVVIGNCRQRIKPEKADTIRIADIVAASSCFPMVFEPLNYPRDFFDYGENKERAQTSMQTQLMDGGIIDNQGVDYLFEANRQMNDGRGEENEKGIDFAIISDAASTSEEDSAVPSESFWQKLIVMILGLFKYMSINNMQLTTFIMTILFGGVSLFIWDACFWYIVFASLSFTSLILTFLVALGKWSAPSALKNSNQYKIPKGLVWKINFLQYHRQLKKRYDSFSKVVSTIMMGHIRKGNLQLVFENTRWINRVIIPRISALSSNGDWKQDNDSSNLMSNASQLMGYSDRASNFHSTLWFSDADKEKNIPEIILACGQFSICYEIYRWSLSHKGNQTNIRKVHGQLKSDKMRKKLKQDWEKFKESPNWMIDLKKIN